MLRKILLVFWPFQKTTIAPCVKSSTWWCFGNSFGFLSFQAFFGNALLITHALLRCSLEKEFPQAYDDVLWKKKFPQAFDLFKSSFSKTWHFRLKKMIRFCCWMFESKKWKTLFTFYCSSIIVHFLLFTFTVHSKFLPI